MNKMFDPEGVVWEFQGDWLVSPNEIKKNDEDRSAYATRHVDQDGRVLWFAEFEWTGAKLTIMDRGMVGGLPCAYAFFTGPDVYWYGTYPTVLEALDKMDKALRKKRLDELTEEAERLGMYEEW